MSSSRCRLPAALVCAAALALLSAGSPAAQTPGNQTPAAPANQTGGKPAPPAKPAEPPPTPGTPIHISPGIVTLIQEKLLAAGHPVPSVSGAWGDFSTAALAAFQRKAGLDPGGDLDELTLTALGMPEVLRGEVPAGGDRPVSAAAAATGGAPLSVSPRLTRVVQTTLAQAGFAPHNVVGIWIPEMDNSSRNFQRAKGLDITNTLDLQVLHALDLTSAFLNPTPGKLPTDAITSVLTDAAQLMTGTPLRISAVGLRQVQTALTQKGHKAAVNGKWSDALAAAVKAFQDAQKLDATGSLDLRTLRALGFANPIAELDLPKKRSAEFAEFSGMTFSPVRTIVENPRGNEREEPRGEPPWRTSVRSEAGVSP